MANSKLSKDSKGKGFLPSPSALTSDEAEVYLHVEHLKQKSSNGTNFEQIWRGHSNLLQGGNPLGGIRAWDDQEN